MRLSLPALLLSGSGLLALPALAGDPQALCAGRAGCVVTAVTDAGFGDRGEALRVIELNFEEAPEGTWGFGISCYEGWREFYLEAGERTAPLIQLCNDGYGASGVGEDTVEVAENRLLHTQYGGSSWRWTQTLTYALEPLAILQENWEGFWGFGINYEAGRWDWTDWSRGDLEWWAPHCTAEDTIPEPDFNEPPPEEITHAVLIPMLEADAIPGGAEGAAPGTCATVISAETERGFVIHGDAAAAIADHAWIKILAVQPDRLYVSVRTSRVASGGTTWLADDHLEIWQGDPLSYMDQCMERDSAARQWGIRLGDSAVFNGAGEPQTLPKVLSRSSTLDSDGGFIVNMTLQLAEPLSNNLTVVFSKGDGKTEQLWMLASSNLRFEEPATLGTVFTVNAGEAACVLNEGRLDVETWGRPVPEMQ